MYEPSYITDNVVVPWSIRTKIDGIASVNLMPTPVNGKTSTSVHYTGKARLEKWKKKIRAI